MSDRRNKDITGSNHGEMHEDIRMREKHERQMM